LNLEARSEKGPRNGAGARPGRLVILSGPSGVGKDTVLEAWRRANPRVQRVVAYTTRQIRDNEVDGVDYHFVSKERFQRHVAAGDFLEHKEVHGNCYATPLADMERMLEEGKVAVLKIDVQGALTARDLRPDALSIFLLPPDFQELERRIVGRATDDPDAIQRRLANARGEMALADRYDVRIVNDDIDEVVRRLEQALNAE
jgi:guanylate kinase